MGISIPIGAEHYDKLKTISDKLGLGLKKTIEYLVSYYLQREIERSVVESKEVKPSVVETRKIQQGVVESKEVKPSVVETRKIQQGVVESKEVKPSVVETRQVKPIRELLEELSREYDILPPNLTPTTSVPKPQSVTAFNSDIIKRGITPSLQDIVPSCSRCGSPKRANAKYCCNCGSLL